MIALLSGWRLWGLLGAVGLVLAGGWYVTHLRAEAATAKAERDQAIAAKVTAEAQSGLNTDIAAATETAQRAEVVIITRTERATRAVEAAQGGDAPVADDVAAAFLDGVRNVRADPAATEPDSPADPARDVPSS